MLQHSRRTWRPHRITALCFCHCRFPVQDATIFPTSMGPQSLKEVVQRQIRLLRAERGLTQEQLCERSGISLDAVNRIERGTRVPTIETLERLAKGLNVPVGQFFAPERDHRPRKPPAPIARLVAFLEGESAEVQEGALELARALVRTVHARR